MARQSVVRELEAAQDLLWDVDRRRYAIDDVIWRLIKGGPHSQHEYLTAKLDLAHAYMVGRDIAERAVIAALEAPCPSRVEAERARDLLSRVLHDYRWHGSSSETTGRLVRVSTRRRAGRSGRPRLTASDVHLRPHGRASGQC